MRNILLAALLLAGCTETTVTPLAADTVQITTSADSSCSPAAAQRVATRQAAVQTLRSGFDSFMIQGQQAQNSVHVVGYTPMVANSTSNSSSNSSGSKTRYSKNTTTTYSGGQPIMGGTYDHIVVVKMFHGGDPAGANAVPARAVLGPNWAAAMQENGGGGCL